MSLLNRLWSGADFWQKEENEQQKQQFAQTRAQQQPRPVVQTKSAPTLQNNRNVQPRVRDQITRPTIRTVDNAPGFQWSNNSLTRGLSRGFDQLNPLDSGRSWQTRTPSEEQSQQSGLSQAGKILAPATGRFLNTAALGGEQIWNTGRMYAAQMSKNPTAFRNANQAALDDYKRYTKEGSGVFGAGSFFKTPEEASSGNLKTVAKRIGGGTLESATEVGSLGLGGFVGKKILQQGLRKGIVSQAPTIVKNAGVNAVQGGASAYNQDAGMGDIVKSAALGAGLGTAADIGLGVGGAVVAQAAKPLVQTTTRLAKNTANSLLDSVAPVQTTTRLVKRTNRLNLDTTDALKAYSDMLVDADPYIQGKVRSDLIARVRQIGDDLGVDLTNGSVADKMERIEAILNGYLPINETGRKLALTPLNEDGFIAGPLALDFSDFKKKGMVFDGVDGKPRFEVDDSGAKIKNQNGSTLGDVLDHPELYRQYPDLRNVKVEYAKSNDFNGHFDGGNNTLTLNPSLPLDKQLGTVLHETQHGIQSIENFAKGTSPNANTGMRLSDKAFNELYDRVGKNRLAVSYWKRAIESGKTIDEIIAEEEIIRGTKLPTENIKAIKMSNSAEDANKILALTEKSLQREMDAKKVGLEQYHNSAGEAEARAVQARMDMPMSERYVKPKETWYHGTNAVFDKFDQSKIGSTTDDGIFGRGFYFSNDKKFAQQAPKGGAKHVMEVQPELDNPLDLSKFKNKKELADYLDMSENALYQQDEGGMIRPTYSQISQFTSHVKEMGHDGVLVPHSKYGGKGDELVVFDADKIKKTKPRSTFYDSLDVPKQDLIIRNDGGKAMSVDKLEEAKQKIRDLHQKSRETGDVTAELQAKQEYKDLAKEVANQDKVAETTVANISESEMPSPIKEEFIKDYKDFKYGGEESLYSGLDRLAGIKESDYKVKWDEPTLNKAKNMLGWYRDFPQLAGSIDATMHNKLTSVLENVRLNDADIKLLNNTQPTSGVAMSIDSSKDTTPLESLKQEARKYKSAEEHLAALHKQAYGVNEPVNIPAVKQTLKDIPNKVQYAQEDAAKHAQDLANLKQQLAEAQAAHLQPTGRTTLDGRPQLNDTSKIQNSLKRQISKQEKSAERYNAQAKLYQAVANKSDLYNQATQPPKSTPVQKQAPQPTKGATKQIAQEPALPAQSKVDTAIRGGQENPQTIPQPKRTGSVGKEKPAVEAPKAPKQKAEPSVQSLKNDTTKIKIVQKGGTKKVTVGKVTLPDDLVGDVNQWKDVGSTLKTMDRNIEAAAPSEAQYRKIHDFAIEPRGRAVTAMVDETAKIKSELKDAVKQYGLKDKSVRADVMRFGEKKIKYSELVEKYGKQKADNIKEADKWFRGQYDRLLEETNAVLRKFNQPEIPKRANYYTHFSDDNLWASVGLKIKQIGQRGDVLQETGGQAIRGRGIDPKLLGQSEFTTPNKKWNPFAQQRKGDKTKYDAVEAFERYLLPTLHNKHLTESVVKTRMVTKAFQDATADTKHLPTFIRQLQEYGNNLAGKTNRFDRPLLETKWGSRALNTTRYMQQQMGRNTILGSVRSAIMQTAALPLSIKEAGLKNTAIGLMEEVGSKVRGKDAAQMSDFLRRRYANFDSVLPSKLRKAENAAGFVFEQIEQTTTKGIWRASHRQAIEGGLSGKAAIKEADRITERLVGGRQIGERAEAFRSVLGNTAMQFQLEVNNFMQEVAKDAANKDAKKLLKLFAATYAFNALVYEPLIGDKPLPDPVDAAIESYENLANGNIAGAAGRMPAEVLSNVPGGSLAAGLYPEYGAKVGGVKLPGRKELFGDTEAGRYGGSLAALGTLQNPEYLIPKSFGLKQVDRTIGGVRDWLQGENKSNKDKQRFEIEQSAPNALRAALLGSYGTNEGKAYLKEQSNKLRGIGKDEEESSLKQIGATTVKDEKGNYVTRDKYDTLINAYYKNKDGSVKVNDYNTDQLRNAIKEVKSDLSNELKQAGFRDLAKVDSRHAVAYAKYRKSIEGKDELEVQKLSKNFYRKSYLGEMDKRTQAFYKLSDDAMRTAIQKGQVNKDQLAKAIEIDNYLTENGLQRYYQIGKKLRAELGIAGGSTGRSGGRRSGGRRSGSGGRKSRLAFEPFKFAKKSSHLNKELRALVESAGAPSKAFPKAKKTPNYS